MTGSTGSHYWSNIATVHPDLQTILEECRERLSTDRHGDAGKWQLAIDGLPDVRPHDYSFSDTVRVGSGSDIDECQRDALLRALRELHPWRKGPFMFFGECIDSEWRSDWKWSRIRQKLGDLTDLRILDVGAGNGYFGWRMLESGAKNILGIDPTVLFNFQHRAFAQFLPGVGDLNTLLPLRLEDMPSGPEFDLVFSLGVIYHRKDPLDHLARLAKHTRKDGRVIVESLVSNAAYAPLLTPKNRYARMRNVQSIPTIETLQQWMGDTGFRNIQIVDVSKTTVNEQRSTEWMRFESLAEGLNPDDSSRTIEGYPAPVRAIIVAQRS